MIAPKKILEEYQEKLKEKQKKKRSTRQKKQKQLSQQPGTSATSLVGSSVRETHNQWSVREISDSQV